MGMCLELKKFKGSMKTKVSLIVGDVGGVVFGIIKIIDWTRFVLISLYN